MKRTFLIEFQLKGEVLVNAEDFDKARKIVEDRVEHIKARRSFLLVDMKPLPKEEKK